MTEFFTVLRSLVYLQRYCEESRFIDVSLLIDSFRAVFLLQIAVDHVVPSYKTGHIIRHGCYVCIRLSGFRISTDAK
jgi:hypothetical protein